MKKQSVITKKLNELNALASAVSSLPEGLEIGEYSQSWSIDVKGQFSLKKTLEIVREYRANSGLASKLAGYGLTSYYLEGWTQKEALAVTYRFAKIDKLDECTEIGLNFTVKSPASALKKLGVKCKIKTVRQEAKLVEASESRKVVCSL
jgi:hypothetical protein